MSSGTEGKDAPAVEAPARVLGQVGIIPGPYGNDSLVAFAGGAVAYVSTDERGYLEGGGVGPLMLGDLKATQAPVPDTGGVVNMRVAAGRDGFVASWVRESVGIDKSAMGAQLIRLGLTGEIIWETPIQETCRCDDPHTLKVAGDYILAGDAIYSWDDGEFLHQAEGVGGPAVLPWWESYSWSEDPSVVLIMDQEEVEDDVDSLADLDLSTGSLSERYTRYTTFEVDGWQVTLTTEQEDSEEVRTIEGAGPDGEAWSTDVSGLGVTVASAGTGGAVSGTVGLGGYLYATVNEDVAIIDVTSGEQVSVAAIGKDTSFYGPVPGALVFKDYDRTGVSWMW